MNLDKPLAIVAVGANPIETAIQTVARKTKTGRNSGRPADKRAMPAAASKAKSAAKRTSAASIKNKPDGKKITAAKPAAEAAQSAGSTEEQIRMRAYFISERRHRLALPGDASSDWLEAKRQLTSELEQR